MNKNYSSALAHLTKLQHRNSVPETLKALLDLYGLENSSCEDKVTVLVSLDYLLETTCKLQTSCKILNLPM